MAVCVSLLQPVFVVPSTRKYKKVLSKPEVWLCYSQTEYNFIHTLRLVSEKKIEIFFNSKRALFLFSLFSNLSQFNLPQFCSIYYQFS